MTLAASGDSRLVRATRLTVVAGLLAAGFCAAWPFRHPRTAQTPPVADPAVVDVPLRRQDVTALASDSGEPSPAVGLSAISGDYGQDYDGNFTLTSHHVSRPDLQSLDPPPVLPSDFGPDSVAGTMRENRRTWEPARLPIPGRQPTLRRHRLTDGDSLEQLAQRYLGSASRAAEIYEVNRDLLPAADLLPLGKIIRIPPPGADRPQP